MIMKAWTVFSCRPRFFCQRKSRLSKNDLDEIEPLPGTGGDLAVRSTGTTLPASSFNYELRIYRITN